MTPPERSPERDAAVEALVSAEPFPGWSPAALRRAAGADADLLFPGGAAEMVEVWTDLVDRRMAEAAGPELASLRTGARVRLLLLLRLDSARAHREAVRRAVSVLALSPEVMARCTARTADAVWTAAGDESTGFSHRSKRLTVAAVYSATLLFLLGPGGEDEAAVAAFLDRRLAGVAWIGRLRGRFRRG